MADYCYILTRWQGRTLSVQIPASMWQHMRLSVRFSRNDALTPG
jgi:hypothetical protein